MNKSEYKLKGQRAPGSFPLKALCALLPLLVALCLLLPCAGPAVAQDEAEKPASEEIQPSYGMELSDADRMLENTERWQVAYRIATPSTLETRCRYDKLVDYTLRFYLGKCCFIEKTASVQEAELKQVFDYYADELGATDEATESSDKTMIFSRWKNAGREVDLTATRRSTGQYLLTYTEFDIEVDKKARRVQESELDALAETTAPAAP